MRIALSILLLWLFVPSWSGAARLALWSAHPAVTSRRVTLGPGMAKGARIGALTWLGGIEIASGDPGFGGYSSLTLARGRFTLLSDGGNWLAFDLDGFGNMTRIATGDLPAGPGTGWEKADRDSESMALDPASGAIWTGFEGANAIWRYAPGFARAQRRVAPSIMRGWPDNGGPESLARLSDGRFLTISETGRSKRHKGRVGFVFDGDPTARPGRGFAFTYRPPRSYDPSDVTQLPDGRFVVLDRRFAPPYNFTAKLVLLDRNAVRPGAIVTGREIATLAAPLLHDNFEGITASRENGATILWLVSDDNQSLLQHTYLLKFRLDA